MSNISFWEKSTLSTDFLIVGAGFLGSWTAYELKRKYPTAKVTVLERDVMSYGASIRNAGFASFGSVTEIMSDINKFGASHAYSLVENRYKGIQKIKSLFADIDYESVGGREFLDIGNMNTAQHSLPEINREMQKITGKAETYQKLGNAHIFNAEEGLINSYKLLSHLHKKCQQLGVDFAFGLTVKKIDSFNTGVYVDAKNAVRELQYFAKKVIVCTNAYTQNMVPSAKVTAQRNHIFVTNEMQLDFTSGCHMFEGYVYFRPLKINGKTHLLIGGGRHLSLNTEETQENSFNSEIIEFLKYITAKYISEKPFKIINQWVGFMGFTEHKSNVLENYAPNTYYAASCNGLGVAMCPIFAQQIVESL